MDLVRLSSLQKHHILIQYTPEYHNDYKYVMTYGGKNWNSTIKVSALAMNPSNIVIKIIDFIFLLSDPNSVISLTSVFTGQFRTALR